MAARLILGLSGTVLTADERAFLRDCDPFGLILFARNIDTPAQVLALTSALRDLLGRDVPILIDQEGGRVQRLRAPHWREYIAPLDDAGYGARAIFLRYALIAEELRQVGIDVNCAPCADIAYPDTHPFLRNRCLGANPATVIENARAAMDAHLTQGVLPVVKHAPGHGRGVVDSHLDLPVVTARRDDLLSSDFNVFAGLADAPLAMSAHVLYSAIDPDHPGTLSPKVVALLRNELGMTGLLISDDLSMQALGGTIAERAQACLAAGCDIALHCNGDLAEMQALAKIAPRLDGPALARADAALALRGTPSALDRDALLAEYCSLLGPRLGEV